MYCLQALELNDVELTASLATTLADAFVGIAARFEDVELAVANNLAHARKFLDCALSGEHTRCFHAWREQFANMDHRLCRL